MDPKYGRLAEEILQEFSKDELKTIEAYCSANFNCEPYVYLNMLIVDREEEFFPLGGKYDDEKAYEIGLQEIVDKLEDGHFSKRLK